MPKSKCTSALITSSTGNPAPTAPATATPPYSSEGPTLPLINDHIPAAKEPPNAEKSSKKRKTRDESKTLKPKGPPPKPAHTLHPSLYTPWVLLPPEVRSMMETQGRIRTEGAGKGNVIPVVFSKNQNVRSGINKLKILLGAHRDPQSTMVVPEVLKREEEDAMIAVSAQGEGTGKLVGIVEMVGRIVAPAPGAVSSKSLGGRKVESVVNWYMYTVLSSVEMEWPAKNGKEGSDEVESEEEEEEAFETLDRNAVKEVKKTRKLPVLTVWLTRKRVGAFAKEFREQSLDVQRAEED